MISFSLSRSLAVPVKVTRKIWKTCLKSCSSKAFLHSHENDWKWLKMNANDMTKKQREKKATNSNFSKSMLWQLCAVCWLRWNDVGEELITRKWTRYRAFMYGPGIRRGFVWLSPIDSQSYREFHSIPFRCRSVSFERFGCSPMFVSHRCGSDDVPSFFVAILKTIKGIFRFFYDLIFCLTCVTWIDPRFYHYDNNKWLDVKPTKLIM